MDLNKLFDTSVAELEKMLSSKTVVGEPIRLEGTTIIPLVSVGFGFGAAGGEASQSKGPSGHGGGASGGGGIKPAAVIIVDGQGARLESVSGVSSVLARVADGVTEIARAKLRADEDGGSAAS